MKAYLKFMLSLNILKHFAKGQTVWSDIRISRKIFKRFLFKDHSHHQSQYQLIDLLKTIRFFVRGDFRMKNNPPPVGLFYKYPFSRLEREQEKNNLDTYGPNFSFDTVCFQHAGHQNRYIYRVQPRRIALYETKTEKKQKSETLVGFRYHQYVEIWDLANNWKYLQSSFNELA